MWVSSESDLHVSCPVQYFSSLTEGGAAFILLFMAHWRLRQMNDWMMEKTCSIKEYV